MAITVTFDSNVWRKVVSPASFPKDPLAAIYADLHNYAKSGRLKGYLGESMFHLEAVPKKQRREYFGGYEAATTSETIESTPERTHIRFGISPNTEDHPGNSPHLKRHLQDALQLGFTLLSAPRIGTPRSPDINSEYYGVRSQSEMKAQQELCFEVFDVLNVRRCGIAVAKALGDAYKRWHSTWLKALENVPEADQHLVAKAIAECADGDAVAGHISYRLDHFCTFDRGVSAGPDSVFSPSNREYLTERFGISFVTPSELHALFQGERES